MTLRRFCIRSLETPAGPRRGGAMLQTVIALAACICVPVAVMLPTCFDSDGPCGDPLSVLGCDPGLSRQILERLWQTCLRELRHDAGGHVTGTVNWWADSLPAAAAESLATNPNAIFIRRARGLNRAAAVYLGRSEATLVFDELTVLEVDAAAGLEGHAAGIRFNGVTHLEAEAARFLGRCSGVLSLNGLKSIGVEAARAIAYHRGLLALNGLEVLDAETAEALAAHEGDLCLNGLVALSPEAARGLALHRHRLNLNGVEFVDDEVALAFAEFQGAGISLNGVAALSAKAARALSSLRHKLESRLPPNSLTSTAIRDDETGKARIVESTLSRRHGVVP